jgi:hypothetical protein
MLYDITGFYDGQDIVTCEQMEVECLVAKPHTGESKKSVAFGHEMFVYNKVLDCYVCPCEQQLLFKCVGKYNDKLHRVCM